MFVCRDGTIALLDQMVGTTTKATARAVTSTATINPATQAAILAAAAVAQVIHFITHSSQLHIVIVCTTFQTQSLH